MARTKTKPVKPAPVEEPEFLGPKEMADFLGVKRATVQQWSYRKVLPEADFVIGKQPVWRLETIIRWALTTGRLDEDDPRAAGYELVEVDDDDDRAVTALLEKARRK